MSAIKTTFKLLRSARQGATPRDFCLAFLCSGLGVMGQHRARLRKGFIRAIGSFAHADQVCLHCARNSKAVSVNMRLGNIADYLVAGEFVAGSYGLPPEIKIKPTAIVDGGANIGIFSLQAARRFPGLPITCYEPDASNVTQLRRNLDENGIAAEIVPKALWSQTAELFFHPAESYAGFVSADPSPYPISCMLPVVPEGCWLKLDIEGAEYEVLPTLLAGGAKPAIISMEIHDFNHRGQSLISLLREHGYEWNESFHPGEQCVNLCALKRDQ